jgi:arylsulfatase A-like enzyme
MTAAPAAQPPPPSSGWARVRAQLQTWARIELYALIWLPTAASALWTKYLMLPRQRDRIGFWDFLSYFRQDILVSCVVLPFLLPWILHRALRTRTAIIASAIASALASLVLFVQLKSYRNVGQLFSLRSLVAAIRWGWHDQRSADSFLPTAGLVKLGLTVGLIAAAAALVVLVRRGMERSVLVHTRGGQFLLGALLVVVVAPWIPNVSPGFFHRSALLSSVGSLFTAGDPYGSTAGKPPTREVLLQRYRALSRTPVGGGPGVASFAGPYGGTAPNANVLLFVFETGPAFCLPTDGDLTDFPNLKRLIQRGFVGRHHYAAAPYTSRSLYALFSGIYPWNLVDDELQRDPELTLRGFARVLADGGYETATYNPHLPWTDPDEEMFRAVGFKRNYFADPISHEKQEHSADHAIALDRQALEQLARDVEGWTRARRPWAVAYLPQIGHGPWHDVSPKHDLPDLPARGRALMALQDKWLGELLALLEREKVLEDTLIVVTADHGVRNAKEAPGFQVGMAEAISFQVPFVLAAPRTLTAPRVIEGPTSHIDVGPTLLALLGLPLADDAGAQGWPLWDPRLKDRRTFFVGQFYFGADAFFESGRYLMRSSLSEKVFASPRFKFGLDDERVRGSEDYAHAAETLAELNRLQRDWAAAFSLTPR